MKKIILFSTIILILLNIIISSAASDDYKNLGIVDKRVLIIQSYSRDYMHTRELETGIHTILNNDLHSVSFRYEFLDTKNYFNDAYMKTLRDLFIDKYSNIHLDGIILCDNDALNFYIAYGSEIFGNSIPVVATGINSIRNYQENNHGIVIIEERPDYERNIDLAINQLQEIDTLSFIYDITTTSYEISGDLELLLKRKYPQYKHNHYLDKTPVEIKNLIDNAPSNEVFFLTIYSRSYEGNSYIYDEFSRYISKDSVNPVYVFWEFYMNSGVLGGYVASSVKYGETAANILIQLWEGKNVTPFIVEAGLNHRYIFDYSVLQKHMINNVPKGSIILNKPQTFWEQHKIVIIVSSVIVVLLILIIILQYSNTKSHQRENILLKQNEEIQKNINLRLEEEVTNRTMQYQLLNTRLELSLLMTEEKNNEITAINNKLTMSLEALQEAQRKLVESEKMASLGNLVAGISHELNTPIGNALTGISFLEGLLQSVKHKFELQTLSELDLENFLSESLEMNTTILTSLNRSIHLMDSLKKLAVENSHHLKRLFDIKEFASEILSSHHDRLRMNNIKLTFDCHESINYHGDPSWLYQILTHFIDNSILHGFNAHHTDKSVYVEIEKIMDEIIIRYIDNGQGIDDIGKSKIFEPFFTTKRANGGSGIGLNLVYNIVVKGLSGSIICDSEPDKGIAFTIRFPANL